MFFTACATYFWGKGLPASYLLRCRDCYKGVHDILSANSGFTNEATNVPRLSIDEVDYGDFLSWNGRRRIERS